MTAQTGVRPADAQTDDDYRQRVQSAVKALAACGVTEDMMRQTSHLSAERWGQLMQSPAGISSRELVYLSGALLQESIYLLTGDERNRIKFSPCSWTSIIKSQYPESEIPS